MEESVDLTSYYLIFLRMTTNDMHVCMYIWQMPLLTRRSTRVPESMTSRTARKNAFQRTRSIGLKRPSVMHVCMYVCVCIQSTVVTYRRGPRRGESAERRIGRRCPSPEGRRAPRPHSRTGAGCSPPAAAVSRCCTHIHTHTHDG